MSKTDANADRLIVLGIIAGAHGVRGDVRVRSFTEAPEDIFSYGPLLSDDRDVLLEAKSVKPAKDHFIVTPKAPRSKEDWDGLKGARLHVPRSRLPAPDDDEFYIEDLVGLDAVSRDGSAIGKVKAVHDFGAGDLLEIAPKTHGEPSFFVPFTMQDVPEVHFATGQVVVLDAASWADRSDPREEDKGD